MFRCLALCGLVLLSESGARSQTVQTLSVPADSPRWELEGEAKAAEYQGRKCLLLNGGGATLKDFVMRDGVVDVDVATPASRGFFGIQFRIADDANAEWAYLRQHKSGRLLRPAAPGRLSLPLRSNPNFVAITTLPRNGARASPTSSSFVNGP